jgi:formate dehydrogenase major subunit
MFDAPREEKRAPSHTKREFFRRELHRNPLIGRNRGGTGVARSERMPRVVVDGRDVILPDTASLADALRAAGVHLPALCHDERIQPTGVCRLCLVRINGAPRPVPACATPVTEGLRIQTSSPDLEAARRGTLQMLARGYPAQAFRGDPDKPFHREIAAFGLDAELAGPADTARVDRSHPLITVDMSRCIQCGRCVRICDEVQGRFVWHVRDRGSAVHIEPDGPDLLNSSCVSCGACVDTCPTGAIEDAAFDTLGSADLWTRTVCPYCGTGCELSVGTRDSAIVSIKPQRHSPVSRGHLCAKGRYAFGFTTATDRITKPMIREKDGWRPTTWDEALAAAAAGLRRAIESGGRDAVGVLASARQTNEENYLTQKFARAVIGTNNVDCCARVCHAPSSRALKQMLGSGLATNSFDDIERADAILVFGANATENHPVVGARIKQAARRRGTTLIVVDPRRTELAEYADCYLPVRPGANIPLLHAMAHVMVQEHLVDRAFVDARVDGYDAFAEFVKDWPPERVMDLCGVEADAIRTAARLYGGAKPAMIVNGLGATEHVQGTETVCALINLALITGNLGKPGAGVNPLRGQNNVQGAAHMGCEPSLLPGSIDLDAGRETFEALWRTPISRAPGLTATGMLAAAKARRVKALWVVGYDVLLSHANARNTARALGALDFVVVQDLFMTETARQFGSVFLPACSSFEKEGTFMNAERRIQRVRQALKPAGGSKPDWQIICELAAAMGHSEGFGFPDPEAIWNEVRDGCEGARGMTYARLDSAGLQWPCPDISHPGTPILHVDVFASRSRAPLRMVRYQPTRERTTPAYPFTLMTGRSLYAFNAGTMTGRSRTHDLRPEDLLEICPDDARTTEIMDGDLVKLVSRYGSATLHAHVNAAMRSGELFATFHTVETFLNAVTSGHADGEAGTPEYKVTAVRIAKVPKR